MLLSAELVLRRQSLQQSLWKCKSSASMAVVCFESYVHCTTGWVSPNTL